MKVILQLDQLTDQDQPVGARLHSGFSLPRGCGIDTATVEIEKAAEAFKRVALELFKADTEGREPKLDTL